MFNRYTRDEGSTYNDLFAARPSDNSKVTDAQQVVVSVNTSKNPISITIINNFTVFMFCLVKHFSILQFYCFIAAVDLRQQ